MAEKFVLGVDVGGTNVRLGIVGENYELSHFLRHSTDELQEGDSIARLADMLTSYLDSAGMRGKVCAVSVGVPGQVSRDHSYVYSVPKVQGLQNTDLGSQLTAALGVDTYVFHDVDLLMLHDIRKLNLDPERSRTIIGCYLGTGFGNSLYINGAIHSGKHGVAAELGHTPFYGVEDICNCGAVGCVETRCCGQYLSQLVEREFPDCHISEIFTRHGDDERILRFVRDCALPIATEITILDPDYVILGGGVITMRDFPIALLEEEVTRRARHPLPAEDINFIYPDDSQSTGVVGGGMAVLEMLAKSNIS